MVLAFRSGHVMPWLDLDQEGNITLWVFVYSLCDDIGVFSMYWVVLRAQSLVVDSQRNSHPWIANVASPLRTNTTKIDRLQHFNYEGQELNNLHKSRTLYYVSSITSNDIYIYLWRNYSWRNYRYQGIILTNNHVKCPVLPSRLVLL